MNTIRRIVMAIAMVVITTAFAFGQDDYHWDNHGIGFSAPSNFVEETSNADEFSAHNDNVFLTILPWQDESIDHDHLAAAVVDIAVEMEYDELTDADELSIDDFEGYYVEGTKDGTNAFVAALLDTESSTNLIVVIIFNDGYESQAASILMSLYPYDD